MGPYLPGAAEFTQSAAIVTANLPFLHLHCTRLTRPWAAFDAVLAPDEGLHLM